MRSDWFSVGTPLLLVECTNACDTEEYSSLCVQIITDCNVIVRMCAGKIALGLHFIKIWFGYLTGCGFVEYFSLCLNIGNYFE